MTKIVVARSTTTPHPLLRLEVQNLRRQRQDGRVVGHVEQNVLVARSVLRATLPLTVVSLHGNGVQVRKVEAPRLLGCVCAAVEGLCDWHKDMVLARWAALFPVASGAVVHGCYVSERNVIR
jgi:hypothetical protein